MRKTPIVFDYSTGTSLALPGEIDVPPYRFVPGTPDPAHYGSPNGCNGCAFRRRLDIRCSRIPCQLHPGFVAELIQP